MSADDFWLTTGRLALRCMTHDDLDWLALLHSDAEVTRYLGGLKTRDQAKPDVFDYVERICNPYCRHSTIGYVSPADFEQTAGLR